MRHIVGGLEQAFGQDGFPKSTVLHICLCP